MGAGPLEHAPSAGILRVNQQVRTARGEVSQMPRHAAVATRPDVRVAGIPGRDVQYNVFSIDAYSIHYLYGCRTCVRIIRQRQVDLRPYLLDLNRWSTHHMHDMAMLVRTAF
jgi:hypothetical protein